MTTTATVIKNWAVTQPTPCYHMHGGIHKEIRVHNIDPIAQHGEAKRQWRKKK